MKENKFKDYKELPAKIINNGDKIQGTSLYDEIGVTPDQFIQFFLDECNTPQDLSKRKLLIRWYLEFPVYIQDEELAKKYLKTTDDYRPKLYRSNIVALSKKIMEHFNIVRYSITEEGKRNDVFYTGVLLDNKILSDGLFGQRLNKTIYKALESLINNQWKDLYQEQKSLINN